jgi:hypothetical protein
MFEAGTVYWCKQDTHLIDYKMVKKKSSYRLTQRAVRIRRGDVILCLSMTEDETGSAEGVFLIGDEMVHIHEHSSTLRALSKALIRIYPHPGARE